MGLFLRFSFCPFFTCKTWAPDERQKFWNPNTRGCSTRHKMLVPSAKTVFFSPRRCSSAFADDFPASLHVAFGDLFGHCLRVHRFHYSSNSGLVCPFT